ncbi:MAG TPA: MFS transporter, partial [Candidatus Limnocylindria bacterium]|nr:MFS transporter [Candidatus Limnocylindria bacterium]
MKMRSRLGPFGQSAFTVYWSGGLVSNIGTWLQHVAASVFVYDRTESALAVGILNFVAFAPTLLFSVTGGVISDRLDRRAVIVATHVISLVVSAALAALTIAGVANELHVMVTAFLLQTSWTIAKPSSA